MELQWLSILVITIMVSNSTQGYHDPPQDVYSYKTGYPGAKSHQQQHKLDPLELHSPTQYITRTLGGLQTLPDSPVSYEQLKEQQENEKLDTAILMLSNTLPQLISLLEGKDDDDDYDEGIVVPVSDNKDTIE